MKRIPDKAVIRALKENLGNVTRASEAIGMTRESLHRRIAGSDKLKAALQESREELLDVAESALIRNVKNGLEASIFFTLKTLGKKRGYSEKQELDITTGGEKINTIRLIEVKRSDS